MAQTNVETESFSLHLSRSVTKERSRAWIGVLVFASAALGAIAVYLWRCRLGADLTDEAFYALPAWKMFGLGDRPFVDEYLNGTRQFDILNYLFVRPWLPFSFLVLRRAAVLVYAACLFALTRFSFRKSWGLTASLAFILCLTFDYFLMPTWSYNWWVRNGLLLHHAALFAAASRSGRAKGALTALAGGLMGIIAIAYNSLLPVPWVAVVVLGVSATWFKRETYPWRRLVLPYLLGALVVMLPDVIYIFSVRADWLESVKAMASMSDYLGGSLVTKVSTTLLFIFGRWELWTFLALVFIYDSDAAWTEPLGKIARHAGRCRAWVAGPFLLVALFILFRPFQIQNILAAYVGLGFCGAVVLALNGWVSRDPFRLTMVISSVLVALGMAFSSANGYLALFWAMPTLLIPFLGEETQGATSRLRPFNLRTAFQEAWGHGVLLIILGAVTGGALTYQRTQTYYDVPPGNCTTPLSIPPFEGMRTSERRAFLIEELARLVKDRPYVLTFSELSGPLLFSQTRAAVDTTLVERVATAETARRSLHKMWSKGRWPTLIVRAKVRPWYWGIHHPLASIPMEYSEQDLMVRFTECVRGRTVADYPEFEAVEVNASQLESCVAGI